jgi:uncharacterized protein (TIGR02588 family)
VAEWIASGIGLLLVGSTVGYLAWSAVVKEESPPDIQVEVLSVVPLRQGYLAQFRATNHGGQAANDVNIHGVLGKGPEAEESEAVVDFLPGGSEKGGGLFFSRQATPEEISVRAVGYQEP